MSFCEGCKQYKKLEGIEPSEDRNICLLGLFPGGIKCLNNRKTSAVDKPAHYTSGAVECIDAIRSALTADEFRGYLKGNIMKYVWRERLKNQDQDLQKAAKYLEWLISEMQKNEKKVE